MLDVYFWSTNKYALRGQEWLIRPLSCVWKDTFYAQTVPQSMQGRLGWAGLGWLADWLFSNDKICMSLPNGVWWHDSRRRGGKKEKRERSHTTAEMGGWTAWDGRADKPKSTLSFHQCNFWLLCDRPPACQAESIGSWGEGWKKKKKLWWQKQAAGVCVQCLYSKTHSTDGSGNKVRVLRALIKKKRRRKKPQTGVINHVGDALTHSWGNEMKRNGYLFSSSNSDRMRKD